MPKLKTNKGARKRFRLTKSGKVKRYKAGKRHLLARKKHKRKRNLAQGTLVDKTFEKKIRHLLGK